jgi:futalosine hydrolase
MIPDICNMYILLAAATKFEIQPAIEFLGNTSSGPIVHSREQKPPLKTPHDIEFLATGIGSIATAHSLMRHIGRRRPDIIIQAGISGRFPDKVRGRVRPADEVSEAKPPGEVMVVREEILADLGVWEGNRFNTIFDLNLKGRNELPFSNGLLINPYEKLLGLPALEQVRGITVNEITTDKARMGWYQQNMDPVVESMEGAALHYICLEEDIAFLQLRSVSNHIGERDKTKWDIPTAIGRLNESLIRLLQELDAHDSSITEITTDRTGT